MSKEHGTLHVTLRVLCAVLGGYAFSAALVALMSVSLPLVTRLPRSEAVILSSMLGFVIYLVVVIWVFAERKLWRAGAGFAMGTVLAFTLAHVLGLKQAG